MVDQMKIKDKALDSFISFMEGLDIDKKTDGESAKLEIEMESGEKEKPEGSC